MPHSDDHNDSPPNTPSHSVSSMSVESGKGPLPRVATTIGTCTAFSHRDKNTSFTPAATVAFIDTHAFPTDNSSTAGYRSRTSFMDSNPASAFPSRAHSLVPDASAEYHFSFGAPSRLSINSSGVLSPDAQSVPALFGLGSQYGFLATPMINNNSILGFGGGTSSSTLGRAGVGSGVSFAEEMAHIRSALITTFLAARAEGINREYAERYSDPQHTPHLTLTQHQNLGSSGDGNNWASSEGAFGSGATSTSAIGRHTTDKASGGRGHGIHRHKGRPMSVVPMHPYIDDEDDANAADLVALGADAAGKILHSVRDEDDDDAEHVVDFSSFIPFMDPMDESSSAGTQAPPSSSTNTQNDNTNVHETISGTFDMSASDMFCPIGVMASSVDTTGHHRHRTVSVLNIRSPFRSSLILVAGSNGGGGGMCVDTAVLKPWSVEASSMSTTGGLRSQSVSVGNERIQDEQLMLPGMSGRTSSLSISITSKSVHGGGRGGGHLDPLSPSSLSSGSKGIMGAYSNFKAPFLGRRVIAKQLFIPVPHSYVADLHHHSRSGSVSTNMSSSRASRTSWPFMDPAMRMRSRRSRMFLGNVPPAPKSVARPSPPPIEFQDSLGNSWTRTEAVVGSGAYSTVYKGTQTHPARSGPSAFSPRHVATGEEPDSAKCAVAIKAIWLGFLTPAQVISVCNGEVMSMIVLSRGATVSNRSSRSSAALSSSNYHNHYFSAQHHAVHFATTSSSTAPDSTPSNGVPSLMDDKTSEFNGVTAIQPTTDAREEDEGHDPSHNDVGGDHTMRSTPQGHDIRSPSFSIGTSFGASMSTLTMGGSSGGGAWSPYVLPLLGFSLAPDTGYLLLVHPLLEGRSLSSLISSHGQLPIAWIKILLADVLRALIVLHASGITHRDVKPQNIFLRKRAPGRLEMIYGAANNPTDTLSSTRAPCSRKPSVHNPLGAEMEWDEPSYCMLGDLGSALVDLRHHRASISTRQSSQSLATIGEVMSDGSIREPLGDAGGFQQPPPGGLDVGGDALQGTPPYMSPEACCGQATSASDLWSVGIMAFQMYTGRLPWRPTELAHPVLIVQQHGRVEGFGPEWQDEFTCGEAINSMNPHDPTSATDTVVSVLQCCLAVNPIQRWTATRLLAEHPFFTNSPETITHNALDK